MLTHHRARPISVRPLGRTMPRPGRLPLLVCLASLVLGSLGGWPPSPVRAAEAVGGFSRRPEASFRALSPVELARIRAWNRSHPEASIDPAGASSLQLHFLKHAAGGREFTTWGLLRRYPRFGTALEYEEAARALASGRADGRRVRRFRRRDGAVVTAETSTGGVVVMAPSGRVKTFFNTAARCSGREPAVRCNVSLHRLASWLLKRTREGELSEIDYSADQLAHEQPLAPLPSSDPRH
jgi:hypothetical protein